MRFGPAAILALAALLALALPGCGEDGAATGAAAGPPAGGAGPASAPAPAPAGARAGAAAATPRPGGSARCRRSLGGFLDAIESLANAAAVGLDYERYLDTLNRVRGTYARVGAERLDLVCLARVAGPAEAALNLYVDAANEWGECLAEGPCELDSIEARVQRRWGRASTRLAQARSGLRIRH